jgi:hypothetical protein
MVKMIEKNKMKKDNKIKFLFVLLIGLIMLNGVWGKCDSSSDKLVCKHEDLSKAYFFSKNEYGESAGKLFIKADSIFYEDAEFKTGFKKQNGKNKMIINVDGTKILKKYEQTSVNVGLGDIDTSITAIDDIVVLRYEEDYSTFHDNAYYELLSKKYVDAINNGNSYAFDDTESKKKYYLYFHSLDEIEIIEEADDPIIHFFDVVNSHPDTFYKKLDNGLHFFDVVDSHPDTFYKTLDNGLNYYHYNIKSSNIEYYKGPEDDYTLIEKDNLESKFSESMYKQIISFLFSKKWIEDEKFLIGFYNDDDEDYYFMDVEKKEYSSDIEYDALSDDWVIIFKTDDEHFLLNRKNLKVLPLGFEVGGRKYYSGFWGYKEDIRAEKSNWNNFKDFYKKYAKEFRKDGRYSGVFVPVPKIASGYVNIDNLIYYDPIQKIAYTNSRKIIKEDIDISEFYNELGLKILEPPKDGEIYLRYENGYYKPEDGTDILYYIDLSTGKEATRTLTNDDKKILFSMDYLETKKYVDDRKTTLPGGGYILENRNGKIIFSSEASAKAQTQDLTGKINDLIAQRADYTTVPHSIVFNMNAASKGNYKLVITDGNGKEHEVAVQSAKRPQDETKLTNLQPGVCKVDLRLVGLGTTIPKDKFDNFGTNDNLSVGINSAPKYTYEFELKNAYTSGSQETAADAFVFEVVEPAQNSLICLDTDEPTDLNIPIEIIARSNQVQFDYNNYKKSFIFNYDLGTRKTDYTDNLKDGKIDILQIEASKVKSEGIPKYYGVLKIKDYQFPNNALSREKIVIVTTFDPAFDDTLIKKTFKTSIYVGKCEEKYWDGFQRYFATKYSNMKQFLSRSFEQGVDDVTTPTTTYDPKETPPGEGPSVE